MFSDSLSKIRSNLMNNPVISDVFYQEGLVDNIESNIKKIGYISLIIGILFIFVAITLIHNTIKLALHSNRFLIKNMELIGASWGFISKPYLIRSLRNGFWSALIAIVLLSGLLVFIQLDYSNFSDFQYPVELSVLFAGLIILGILISSLSTLYVVNKYLRMRMDDLY
jgi:cell division transport system permease protein